MPVARKPKQKSFYLFIGIVGLAAVLVGFFTTYIRPSFSGKFSAPLVVHIHGAFALLWVLLFLVQTLTVKFRNIKFHRRLGYTGAFIAAAIIVTLFPTGMFQVKKEYAMGLGDTAISQIVGIATTALMFGSLVGCGLAYRRQPKIHKRFLLLATIVLLWPAWFRFRHYFPSVPRPDIWFAVVLADSLIVLAWIVDLVSYRRIHPVLLYGGLLIIIEHSFEVIYFDSHYWRIAAKAIHGFLS